MTTEDLSLTDFTDEVLSTKPNKKQKHRSFMKHAKGLYWKQSPDQQWADRAKESYKRISERENKL